MSLITRRVCWPVWKFGVLKVAMLSFGILAGSNWPALWKSSQVALWVVFLSTCLASTIWGIQDFFSAPSEQRPVA